MKRFSLILTVFFLSLTSAAAYAKSKVVYVYSEPCRMCVEFDSRVLSDPAVKEKLAQFKFEKVNANTGRFNVNVTPTILIYNEKNKLIRKYIPTLNKGKFLEVLNQAE